MELKIRQFILVVTDQTKSLDFYTGKVGFEKKIDYTPPGSYRWVTVGPHGQGIELALWQVGSPDPDGHTKSWKPGNAPPITLSVKDCHETFAEMKSRGVKFHQEQPYDQPWGISASFDDPDGNTFAINQYRHPPRA
jgi:predicted enzyme related to lactoylglutathione lyase